MWKSESERHSMSARGMSTKDAWLRHRHQAIGQFAKGWSFKINNIQDIWQDETSDDTPPAIIGKKIEKRLKKWLGENHHILKDHTNGELLKDYDANAYNELEGIMDNFKNFDKYADNVRSQDEFNEYLAALYNWADDYRVWLDN